MTKQHQLNFPSSESESEVCLPLLAVLRNQRMKGLLSRRPAAVLLLWMNCLLCFASTVRPQIYEYTLTHGHKHWHSSSSLDRPHVHAHTLGNVHNSYMNIVALMLHVTYTQSPTDGDLFRLLQRFSSNKPTFSPWPKLMNNCSVCVCVWAYCIAVCRMWFGITSLLLIFTSQHNILWQRDAWVNIFYSKTWLTKMTV